MQLPSSTVASSVVSASIVASTSPRVSANEPSGVLVSSGPGASTASSVPVPPQPSAAQNKGAVQRGFLIRGSVTWLHGRVVHAAALLQLRSVGGPTMSAVIYAYKLTPDAMN